MLALSPQRYLNLQAAGEPSLASLDETSTWVDGLIQKSANTLKEIHVADDFLYYNRHSLATYAFKNYEAILTTLNLTALNVADEAENIKFIGKGQLDSIKQTQEFVEMFIDKWEAGDAGDETQVARDYMHKLLEDELASIPKIQSFYV